MCSTKITFTYIVSYKSPNFPMRKVVLTITRQLQQYTNPVLKNLPCLPSLQGNCQVSQAGIWGPSHGFPLLTPGHWPQFIAPSAASWEGPPWWANSYPDFSLRWVLGQAKEHPGHCPSTSCPHSSADTPASPGLGLWSGSEVPTELFGTGFCHTFFSWLRVGTVSAFLFLYLGWG